MSLPDTEDRDHSRDVSLAASAPGNGRLTCPSCGGALRREGVAAPLTEAESIHLCERCGGRFGVRLRVRPVRRNGVAWRGADSSLPGSSEFTRAAEPGEEVSNSAASLPTPAPHGLGLSLRAMGLEMLASFYPVCTCLGSAVLLGLGGFVPVVRKWLRNEIRLRDARAVVHALGGVWLTRERVDPDADFGPVLQRCDAPLLFDEVEELSRRMGARPPSQTRLTYLPCCGVVAWGRRRQALLLGLPLLPVLSRGELRAVLAHELAHLARGDLRRLDRAAHFVERLGQGLEQLDLEGSRWKASSPLRAWARWNYGAAQGLRAPIVRGQEARADRAAATLAGGGETASALVKVAMVQPLFREVLVHYDAARGDLPNLFAFFRSFWVKMPGGMRMAMRHSLLCDRRTAPNPAHPHLLDRLSLVQTKPPRPFPEANLPATSVIGDLEAFEQMLHARLFATDRFEASIFHRAGS